MNKRANISTFVFVMMVLVVCMFALWSFSKNNSKSSSEFEDLSINLERMQVQEKGDIYLQIISDKALISAYNKGLDKFGDATIIASDIEKQKYLEFFSSEFKKEFLLILEGYPEQAIATELKENFKSVSINFDGLNIVILTNESAYTSGSNNINVASKMNFNYETSFEKLGLV